MFDDKIRIAITLYIEITVQHPVTHGRAGIGLCLPGPARTEFFEGNQRRQQLHGRGRIARHIGGDGKHWLGLIDLVNIHAQTPGRQIVALEYLHHFRGQGFGRRRLSRQRHQQKQAKNDIQCHADIP